MLWNPIVLLDLYSSNIPLAAPAAYVKSHEARAGSTGNRGSELRRMEHESLGCRVHYSIWSEKEIGVAAAKFFTDAIGSWDTHWGT